MLDGLTLCVYVAMVHKCFHFAIILPTGGISRRKEMLQLWHLITVSRLNSVSSLEQPIFHKSLKGHTVWLGV